MALCSIPGQANPARGIRAKRQPSDPYCLAWRSFTFPNPKQSWRRELANILPTYMAKRLPSSAVISLTWGMQPPTLALTKTGLERQKIRDRIKVWGLLVTTHSGLHVFHKLVDYSDVEAKEILESMEVGCPVSMSRLRSRPTCLSCQKALSHRDQLCAWLWSQTYLAGTGDEPPGPNNPSESVMDVTRSICIARVGWFGNEKARLSSDRGSPL